MANTTQIYGIDGSTLITLNQISEGNYSSEYMARTSDAEYRIKVRHSKEKAVAGAVALDRHNVELTVRVFPSAEVPNGRTEQAYIVVRTDPNSDGSSSITMSEKFLGWATARLPDLVRWVSNIG